MIGAKGVVPPLERAVVQRKRLWPPPHVVQPDGERVQHREGVRVVRAQGRRASLLGGLVNLERRLGVLLRGPAIDQQCEE